MADFSLGAVTGVPVVLPTITPWVAYTPTITGLSVGYTINYARWRQVGDTIEVRIAATCATGATGATEVAASLPSGQTISQTALGSGSDYNTSYTHLGSFRSTGSTSYFGHIIGNTTSTVRFYKPSSGVVMQSADFAGAPSVAIFMNIPTVEAALTAVTAYGAGQATAVKAGLVKSYEEGTFTPTFTASGGGAATTYSNQFGEYTKVGNIVHFSLRVTSLSFSAAGTGNVKISGLPFTAFNNEYKVANIGFSAGWSAGQNPLLGIIPANSTTIELIYRTGNSTPSIGLPVAAFSSSCDVIISGSYRAVS